MVAVLGLATASGSWGATAACTTPTVIGSTTGGVGTTVNKPPSGNTPGCIAVDDLFNGFPTGAAGAFVAANTPAGYLFTGAGTFSPDPTLDHIDVTAPHLVSGAPGTGIQFTNTSAAGNWNASGGGNATLNTSITFSVDSKSTQTAGHSVLDYANLVVTVGSIVGGGTTFSVVENVCPNTLIFTAGCTGERTVTITLTAANQNTTVFGAPAIFASAVTQIAVQDIVNIRLGAAGADTAQLLSFTDEFGTPEPSTFILFGAGLIALGYVEFRRRKLQA